MEPSLAPTSLPAGSTPRSIMNHWSRKVFRGLLGLAVLTLFVTVVGTFVSRGEKKRQTKAEAFASWVSWRQTHCRFQGRLENGTFVCDNGQRYPVGLVRGKESPEAPVGFAPR